MLASITRDNRLFMLGNFLFALSYGLWMNLRPLHLGHLGATPEQVGSVLSVVAIAGGLLPIPAGLLSDRIGPKRVIMGAWLVAALGTLIAALASDWPLAGVGFATFMLVIAANPATIAFVIFHASGEDGADQSGRVMAVVFASWPAAMIFAPALGGVVADRYGISATLWLGVAGFLAAVAVLSLAADARSEQAGPLVSGRGLAQNRRFLVAVAFFSLVLLAAQVGYVLAPNFLESVRGFSLATIGVLYSLFSVGTLTFNLVVSRNQPRFNVPFLLCAVILATFVLWRSEQGALIAVAFVLLGAITTFWVVAQVSYGKLLTPAQRGLGIGVSETVGYLMIALAAWLAGRLFETTPAHDLPFIMGLALMMAMLALWLFAPRLRRIVAG